jgi:hypothetical protein
MRQNILKLTTAFFLCFLAFGCEEALDKKNLENLVADDLWQDPVLLKGFMDKTMKDNLPGEGIWGAICDEDYGQYDLGLPYDNIEISVAGASNQGTGYIEEWLYGGIRNINQFLDNVDKCPEDKLPVATKNDYVAQMKVLRAWKYFQMVRIYGGVPLLLHAQQASDELYVSREKTSVCIAQIIRDLDDAINMGEDFPMRRADTEAGRISRAVALALKGRILLYYASPQFSKETPAGTKDAATRWAEAYTANKTAITELTNAVPKYGLFRPSPANAEEAIQNYRDMFSEAYEIGENNPEMIWVIRHQYPVNKAEIGPVGGTITLELANAFANADGSPYTGLVIPAAGSAAVPLDTLNVPYWKGREPRFYTTVIYNGKEHPMYRLNANDTDEEGRQIHWWKFIGGSNAPYNDCSRLDVLGMHAIKRIDMSVNETVADGNHSGLDFPLIRYAEVLLNLAECAAKTNREAEAIKILYDIRKRAGIPEGSNHYGIGTPSGDALILAILNERRIELALEGFRFWDIRRWRLFTDPIAGYKINGLVRHTLKADPKMEPPIPPEILATIDIENDPDSYFAVFDNVIYAMDAGPFNVGERQYFYRIAYEEHIKKNPNLAQTILWENGTFNPYE